MFPLRIFSLHFSRKIFVGAAVFLTALILSGVFLYEVYAQPLTQSHKVSAYGSVSAGTVYLSPSAQAAAQVSSTAKEPMQEVHVANNGLILLRGARVLSISGNTIHLGMAFGPSDFTWAAVTKYNTIFLNKQGAKETLSDIGVGDTVTVTGLVTGSGAEPTIDTDFVRE